MEHLTIHYNHNNRSKTSLFLSFVVYNNNKQREEKQSTILQAWSNTQGVVITNHSQAFKTTVCTPLKTIISKGGYSLFQTDTPLLIVLTSLFWKRTGKGRKQQRYTTAPTFINNIEISCRFVLSTWIYWKLALPHYIYCVYVVGLVSLEPILRHMQYLQLSLTHCCCVLLLFSFSN